MTIRDYARVGVRAVLYTYDFEPITVVELSQYARERLERIGDVTLEIMEMPTPEFVRPGGRIQPLRIMSVRIMAEELRRGPHSHMMLFTPNDENALLLKSAFLPGQRRSVSNERAEAFAHGFMQAIRTYR